MFSDEPNPLPSVVEAYRIVTGFDPVTHGKRVGPDIVVPCVSKANHKHGDATPSLRINPEKDTWICDPCKAQGVEGGKSTALVVHAGMARDLSEASKFLAPREEKMPPPPEDQRELVAEYDYCAPNGPVLYQVRRFEWPIPGSTRRGKTFSQRRLLEDGQWDNRLGDVERVPFRYPQMIYHAVELGETLYVVEGEKKVLALEALGLCATTNAGGAGWEWTGQFIECFRGVTRVVVIGDNDDVGRAAARARAESLAMVCGVVRLVESIPGIKPKGDICDWLDEHQGATSKDVRKMLAASAKMIGVEIDDGSVTPMAFDVLHQRVLATMNVIVPATPFNVPKFDKAIGGMQEGRITVIAARTGHGKTALASCISMIASLHCKVLVFSLEMGQLQWHDRISAIRHGMTPLAYRLAKRPTLPGDAEWYASHKLLITGGGKNATIETFETLIAIHQPQLVVIDHLRHIRGWMPSGNSKLRADLAASEIMYAFPDIAKKRKTHFMLLHQLGRQAGDEPALEDLRDAGAVEEAADNVILLHRPYKTIRGERKSDGSDEDNIMHAHLAKSREGAELHAHLAWDGPLMLARPWEPNEKELYTRCCRDAR